MTRARELSKRGFEEKGQRAARSTSNYLPKEGIKEVAICTGCKALFWNKRWYLDENVSSKLSLDMVKNEVVCPACQRIADKNPAGIVTFSGEYLAEHRDEILNAIKNSEEKSRSKNPLARIMAIKPEKDALVILTTDDKLAQKLGRDINKAHNGTLEYKWSREDSFVRVNWSR